ncbi:hypothetical protein, partial [Burkholderia cenocepacia]|uniref:hypothetical protein n=1 Tax=Burkholderia cenocepacia TaxID=95486 RepID=UPI001955C572
PVTSAFRRAALIDKIRQGRAARLPAHGDVPDAPSSPLAHTVSAYHPDNDSARCVICIGRKIGSRRRQVFVR